MALPQLCMHHLILLLFLQSKHKVRVVAAKNVWDGIQEPDASALVQIHDLIEKLEQNSGNSTTIFTCLWVDIDPPVKVWCWNEVSKCLYCKSPNLMSGLNFSSNGYGRHHLSLWAQLLTMHIYCLQYTWINSAKQWSCGSPLTLVLWVRQTTDYVIAQGNDYIIRQFDRPLLVLN